MPDIIVLTGNLDYTITLDPSVWIFDDRKVDLTTYFENNSNGHANEPDNGAMDKPEGEGWIIREGSSRPPVKKSVRKFRKDELLTGTFGIPFKPFLENAQPKENAKTLSVETSDGQTHEIPLHDARQGILGFSNKGKFLTEDGPAHFYYNDGSNRDDPITHISKLTVR
jgi:hypothetical protein